MATKKKIWTQTDYDNEAREFVACYGRDYDWYEFVQEYCATWDRANEFKRPDQDTLLQAIFVAVGWPSAKSVAKEL